MRRLKTDQLPPLVRDAVEIWQAGVRAVAGDQCVGNAVHIEHNCLIFGETALGFDEFDRIFVIGAGKASAAMAVGLERVLRAAGLMDRVSGSWINVPDNCIDVDCRFNLHPARPVGVNLPTEAVLKGTQEIIRLLGQMNERDLCIGLISGGGSALLSAPLDPITLEEKRELAAKLSAAGADITQLNCVRQQISQVKGGNLIHACGGGQMINLIMSDIMGDPLDLIASGPTVASQTSPQDAIKILDQFDPKKTLIAASIYRTLEKKRLEEPRPKPRNLRVENVVVANNAIAVDAAGVEAVKRGYNYIMTCEHEHDTDAVSVADQLVQWVQNAGIVAGPDCLISGGEPVVTLCEEPGIGGRNQQVVIEAAGMLVDIDRAELPAEFAMLSGGTDGEDGTSPAAGAWIDQDLIARLAQAKGQLENHRNRNDAQRLFDHFGSLLVTGPTGTNVCDLRIAIVKR